MQRANVSIRRRFPSIGTRCCAAWEQKSSVAGYGFTQIAAVAFRSGRSLHVVTASRLFRRMPMPQIFRPYADSVARATLVTLLIGPFAAIGIAYWTMRSNYITDQTITLGQPVPFSHAHHVGGLGLDCRYCHSAVEKSAIAGIPPTHTCMTCHSQLYTQTEMLAPVRASLAENKPIRWNKVNKL